MVYGQQTYRIVLADDHVLIRHGIKNIIKQESSLQVVDEAGNGEELQKILEAQTVDMIILDITMPKISGIEIARQIKKSFPDIKILILTMHKYKGYLYNALAAGADGYLMKDDSDNEILLAINKIRLGKMYLSPKLVDDFTDDVLTAGRDRTGFPIKGLTAREKEILQLVVDGLTSKEMARQLRLSPRTVDHHRSRLLRKFNMKSTVDLVSYALKNGFVVNDGK